METWSATQRLYLEAMGYQLHAVSGLGERSHPAPLLTSTETSGATISSQLRSHLAKAAGLPFSQLAERVYLPPDLATNPHAKRAFWHVLKGVRTS